MKILLPDDVEDRLKAELLRAGRREIGGVLLGELVSPAVVRVAEVTVQRSGGTSSTFVRIPRLHAKAIQAFFERTGHRYERFNYLGEWHSHPSYPTRPSGSDVRAMNEIIENPAMAVNFAVLSIVKIPATARFEISSYVFVPDASYAEIPTVAARSTKRKQDWRGTRPAPIVRVGTMR